MANYFVAGDRYFTEADDPNALVCISMHIHGHESGFLIPRL